MSEKTFGAFSSSTDPTKLGAAVQGGILAVSGILLFVAQFFGIPLMESDVVTLAKESGIAVGALVTIFGLLRKMVVAFTSR